MTDQLLREILTELRALRASLAEPTGANGYRWTPDGRPICPRHNVPMNRREKQGDIWFSHSVEMPDGSTAYCRGYHDPKSSPGYGSPDEPPPAPAPAQPGPACRRSAAPPPAPAPASDPTPGSPPALPDEVTALIAEPVVNARDHFNRLAALVIPAGIVDANTVTTIARVDGGREGYEAAYTKLLAKVGVI
jgi:hypothetical protein